MGNDTNTQGQGVQSASIILEAQRRKFFWIIGLISLIAFVLASSTVVFAVKANQSYKSSRVEFVVWTHPQVTQGTQHSMKLKVPQNSTVFTLMEHGALKSDHFKFEFSYTTFGRYISSIGGVSESLTENTFWIVYHLKGNPDPLNPPKVQDSAELGVDDLRPDDNDVILFWLTKFDDIGTLNFREKHATLLQRCPNYDFDE